MVRDLRTWAGSCEAGIDSCRRSPICARQDASHDGHHASAYLDPGRDFLVPSICEADVDEALAAYLRPLLARDHNVRRPRDQPVSDCECPERSAPRSGGGVLVDSEHAGREHPAVQTVSACGWDKKDGKSIPNDDSACVQGHPATGAS